MRILWKIFCCFKSTLFKPLMIRISHIKEKYQGFQGRWGSLSSIYRGTSILKLTCDFDQHSKQCFLNKRHKIDHTTHSRNFHDQNQIYLEVRLGLGLGEVAHRWMKIKGCDKEQVNLALTLRPSKLQKWNWNCEWNCRIRLENPITMHK